MIIAYWRHGGGGDTHRQITIARGMQATNAARARLRRSGASPRAPAGLDARKIATESSIDWHSDSTTFATSNLLMRRPCNYRWCVTTTGEDMGVIDTEGVTEAVPWSTLAETYRSKNSYRLRTGVRRT